MSSMRAMVLETVGLPLRELEWPRPLPGPGQVRLRVRACGVCRTDLHVVDGELAHPKLPLVLGHEIVGLVDARGEDVVREALQPVLKVLAHEQVPEFLSHERVRARWRARRVPGPVSGSGSQYGTGLAIRAIVW